MENDTVVFLTRSGEESGDIDESYKWNIEGVAETDETGTLARCVAVKNAGKELGLVGDDADCLDVETGETDDEVLRIVTLYFEEFAVVDYSADYFIHVIGTCSRVRDDFVERIFESVDRVVTFNQRGFFKVVLRYVAEEFADDAQTVFTVFCSEMSHAALRRMNLSAAKCVLRHILAGNGLDNLRTGQEHIGYAFGHDGEVGQGGRIYRAAGTRTEDG